MTGVAASRLSRMLECPPWCRAGTIIDASDKLLVDGLLDPKDGKIAAVAGGDRPAILGTLDDAQRWHARLASASTPARSTALRQRGEPAHLPA
jgi:hypothetical protein